LNEAGKTMVAPAIVSQRHWDRYQAAALDLGFAALAAAPKHDIACADAVRDWVAEGFNGEMDWYARGLEKRLDLSLVMADAASVWVLTTPYHPEPCTLAGHKLARYACGDDYHEVLAAKLKRLCALVTADFPGANLRPYVDTGPVLERYWAQAAGLGWIGKNGNLIHPTMGSYLFLCCIVCNLTVPYGTPHQDFCGSCRACIDACPTAAIVKPGVVDARRCISYLSIEHRGPFAAAPDFADWLFGCDICQEVCPWTVKFAGPERMPELAPRKAYEDCDEAGLAAMDQPGFSALFRKSAIKRTKLAGLKRNLTHLRRPDTP